ncbi:pyridoxamine-phosphate oxidase PDX3 [Sporobolomyces koalae]|uniref:pyridoxamine-phosphate oxidase PDX3 n=1 Tax=Sporobolomyces koalae TaxID=500713 RepID=UPI003174B0C3
MSKKLNTVENHETYMSQGIPSASALDPNPLKQFSQWFEHAQSKPTEVPEPEAMSISTVSTTAGPVPIPSTRVVLLKQVDERGFVFYTNYASRKGRELFPQGYDDLASGETVQGAYASIAFYWRALHLSVRVVGRVEKVDRKTTQEYFDGRPVGSRIGAWASAQSEVLHGGREELEDKVRALERKFGLPEGTATGTAASAVDVGPKSSASGVTRSEEEIEIPVPPFWGGVRIVPFEVEFWAGRPSRLHDRFRYSRPEGDEASEWKIERLSP